MARPNTLTKSLSCPPGPGPSSVALHPSDDFPLRPIHQSGNSFATAAVITTQPTKRNHVPVEVSSVLNSSSVSAGLEPLSGLDFLIVKQKTERRESISEFETRSKYNIKDSQGRKLFTAKEYSDSCNRGCFGNIRPFEMKIKDAITNQEVIHLSRPLACGTCLFPFPLQIIQVFTPLGELAGTVEQSEWGICISSFAVKDTLGRVVLGIEGPGIFCACSICEDAEFQILSWNGKEKVGKISRKWSGLLRETYTEADSFGISFPINLNAKIKALLLGAYFLIDFMLFKK